MSRTTGWQGSPSSPRRRPLGCCRLDDSRSPFPLSRGPVALSVLVVPRRRPRRSVARPSPELARRGLEVPLLRSRGPRGPEAPVGRRESCLSGAHVVWKWCWDHQAALRRRYGWAARLHWDAGRLEDSPQTSLRHRDAGGALSTQGHAVCRRLHSRSRSAPTSAGRAQTLRESGDQKDGRREGAQHCGAWHSTKYRGRATVAGAVTALLTTARSARAGWIRQQRRQYYPPKQNGPARQ